MPSTAAARRSATSGTAWLRAALLRGGVLLGLPETSGAASGLAEAFGTLGALGALGLALAVGVALAVGLVLAAGSPGVGLADDVRSRPGGTFERYRVSPGAANTRARRQVGTACHAGTFGEILLSALRRGRHDQCRPSDGRLRPPRGDRPRGGRRADSQPAGGPARRRRQLDRLAVLAPDPGPGRSRGGRFRRAAGMDRGRKAVRAAVRPVRHRLRAQLTAGIPGHGLVR